MHDNASKPRSDDDRMTRFAGLWVRSQAVVSAYVFGLIRNPHDAEDVLSSVAEAAVADFDRYDVSKPFTAWVVLAKMDHAPRPADGDRIVHWVC